MVLWLDKSLLQNRTEYGRNIFGMDENKKHSLGFHGSQTQCEYIKKIDKISVVQRHHDDLLVRFTWNPRINWNPMIVFRKFVVIKSSQEYVSQKFTQYWSNLLTSELQGITFTRVQLN